ncbi:MAG: AAA family ATPase [Thermoleophilia bacterium]|nr:AAA family ATPase [Thermoleophilia bacterium]
MTASAPLRRALAYLAVAAMSVSGATGATGATPPQALTEPFGAAGAPMVTTYGQVLKAARGGHINAARVDAQSRWVTAMDDQGNLVAAPIPAPRAGADFGSDAPPNPAGSTPTVFTLAGWLRAHHVTVLAAPAAAATTEAAGGGMPGWVVPLGFAALMALLMAFIIFQRRQPSRGRGGATGHGRMRKTAKVEAPRTRFSDVAGCDEAVDELQEVVHFLSDPGRFRRVGARMPRGVILYGPPGTGKTLLAKAVAGEAGTAFFAVSGSDFVDTFVGVGAARVRDLFEQARKEEDGAIIFFDEIDAIGRQRGGGSGSDSEREATLNQLLVELDGFGPRDRVVVMAATNRVDMLDQALTRPGRFDRRVQVGLPAENGRREILGLYSKNKPIEDETSLDHIAAVTAGFSGADLSNLLNEAAIMAARDARPSITRADLDEGMLRAIAGPQKRDRKLAPGELEQIAWHEAGHCLAAELCPTHTKTQRVTIAPRGDAGGLALYGTEDRALTSPQRLHERMIVAMAGRAAEQIRFGQISSGAANDLEQASGMARQAIERLGFSSRIGQIAVGGSASSPAPVSDATRSDIEYEITSMVDGAYRDAVQLLQEHRDSLDALAQSLLLNEQIDRPEIERITGGIARTEVPGTRQVPAFAHDDRPRLAEATPRTGGEREPMRIAGPGRRRRALTHAPGRLVPVAKAIGRAGGAAARGLLGPPAPARPAPPVVSRLRGSGGTDAASG